MKRSCNTPGAITEGIKGVVLTHGNLVANTLQISSWIVRARKGKEVVISVLPFFHVYGMAVAMNVPIHLASTMVILPRFEVMGTLQAIKRYRPTFFPGVPTMFVALSQEKSAEKYNLSSLRVCYSGAAPLAVDVLEDFEKLTGARIIEGYGLAEASPATHCNPVFGKRKPGSIGLPYPDTLARIVDLETGEKGPPSGGGGRVMHQRPPGDERLLEDARRRPPGRFGTAGYIPGILPAWMRKVISTSWISRKT